MIIAIKGLITHTHKKKTKQIQIFNERTLTILVSVINNDNQQAILSEKKG